MAGNEEWVKEQLKPLSMFELAKWWADGIKVIGAGNGTGLLAAGAALNSFQGHHAALLLVKIAGTVFFVGVFAFAISFFSLHKAMFAQDEVAQATLRKDAAAIKENSAISSSSMGTANNYARVGTAAFFGGCLIGLAGFLTL